MVIFKWEAQLSLKPQVSALCHMTDSSMGILIAATNQIHLCGCLAGDAQLTSSMLGLMFIGFSIRPLQDQQSVFIIWKIFLFRLSTKWQQISLEVRTKAAFVSVLAKECCVGHENALLMISFKVGD